MFSPLDILYIVLAFCVLWITAGLFWLVWQAASMLRSINVTVREARERIVRMEHALSGIQGVLERVMPGDLIASSGRKLIESLLQPKHRRKKS